MAKYIKIKFEETYKIPDDWELIKNSDGIVKIKVNNDEFYDFGSIPYSSLGLDAEEEFMLTAEEFLAFQNKGFDLILADNEISEITEKKEIENFKQLENE